VTGLALPAIRAERARRLVLAALLGAVSLGAYAEDVARGDSAAPRRDEALGLSRKVEGLTPRPSMRIEDLVARRKARERLAEEAAVSSKAPLQGEDVH